MTKDKSKESWKQRHPKFFDIAYKVIIYAVIGLGAWVISSNYYNFYVFLSEQKHLF
jgi:flagellar biosynthesis/type III secretory pathway M-ring protein FliF/YscJ